MKKALLACVVLLAVSSCTRGVETRWIDRGELPKSVYRPTSQQTTRPRRIHVDLYFVRTTKPPNANVLGTFLKPIQLGVRTRSVLTALSRAEVAVRLLLRGPTTEERLIGYASAIDLETELISISVEDRIADVNLSAVFENVTSDVGNLMRIAEVVWTLTDIPNIDFVRFRIHGVPQPVIDQNGVPHAMVGRSRYSTLAPRVSSGTEGGSVVPGGPEPTAAAP
jgi:hypothetical protein